MRGHKSSKPSNNQLHYGPEKLIFLAVCIENNIFPVDFFKGNSL